MKLGKLSLVAVMALGTSAFAIDNVKVNGEAKLWYQTSEYSGLGAGATTSQDFFDNTSNSMADVKLSIGATADLAQSLSAGIKVTALSTLGLENNLVGATPAAKRGIDGVDHQTTGDMTSLDDQSWTEELYLAYTAGKTTVKIGRQALNTPLAFTETWNVVDNTFEAAVLLNNDLPDTTLVAAWVGKHNGVGVLNSGRGSTVAYNGKFGDFAVNGAYAAGAVNKSIPDTAIQAWYYSVDDVATAYWLQADAKLMGMVNLGVQYSGMNPDDTSLTLGTAAANHRDTDMFAVKGAVDVAGVNVYAAYSTVSDGSIGFANVATGDKSSMYTTLGSIYMDGEIVAAPDTDAWKVGASTKMIPGVTLSASYCEAETGNNGGTATTVGGASTLNTDFSAWDVVAATKVGPVDLTAIYTQFDKDVKADDLTDKTTDTLRIIASLKF
ncbi:MAG: OprD family outer membrane porin [Sulfuricurvum sp.]|uniref:porin n=1 Tax=Sulfuricurvum sp. TaxID=2025608 RepID=UPI00271A4341|nr:porin [Sulfuricurvum sp.]MDO9057368.1 OprD family outer membrane porin [Sulfuricurvum sp.]